MRDSRVLLLDEATSSLDTRHEASIMSTIWKHSENRTSLIIAQRLSTIRNANRIFVVEGGKIVEVGSHVELLDVHGVYYSLVSR